MKTVIIILFFSLNIFNTHAQFGSNNFNMCEKDIYFYNVHFHEFCSGFKTENECYNQVAPGNSKCKWCDNRCAYVKEVNYIKCFVYSKTEYNQETVPAKVLFQNTYPYSTFVCPVICIYRNITYEKNPNNYTQCYDEPKITYYSYNSSMNDDLQPNYHKGNTGKNTYNFVYIISGFIIGFLFI